MATETKAVVNGQTKEQSKLSSFFGDTQTPTFAKIGMYGSAGTGKSRGAVEIAIGMFKKYNLKKPIVYFDTENGSDYLRGFFEKENIPFFVKKSRTFKDLMEAVSIAEKEASILIVDSITHVWRELTGSYLAQYNRERFKKLCDKTGEERAKELFKPAIQLEFQHWNVIKPRWAKFTDAYLNSNIHMIVCGRAGDIYDYQENENGKKELIKSGSRMATEKELSYEPSLLIELQRRNVNGEEQLIAIVEKDRSDTINGKEFNLLKFNDVLPHFEFLKIGKQNKNIDMYQNESGGLFEGQTMNPEDDWAIEKRKRAELTEEIKGLLFMKIPGMDQDSKKKRLELYEKHFGTVSETKIENTNSETLAKNLVKLRVELQSI